MAPATKKEAHRQTRHSQGQRRLPRTLAQLRRLSKSLPTISSAISGAPASSTTTTRSAASASPSTARSGACIPQTVNAVNLPLDNGLNFPAAILQPPFFDPKAPAAHNYGAIGTIIGHEISHTFDSEGAAFDSMGRVRNWWTPEDLAHFNAVTAALAAQYDTYAPFPDLHVNGNKPSAKTSPM